VTFSIRQFSADVVGARRASRTVSALLIGGSLMGAMPAFAEGAALPASAPEAPAPTSWAAQVHDRLAQDGKLDPQTEARFAGQQAGTAAAAPAPHAVTAWARQVEERLAVHAHHVASAGRSALAWSEHGVASWYGRSFRGHRTSSGSRFDPLQLTAAHPSLPLGTKLLVTSESTGRSVVVTVNDRGPFSGRIIDLSRAAAAKLGMLGSGTDSVTLQRATPEEVEVAQAAADDDNEQALSLVDDGVARSGAHAVSPARHGRPQTHLADR